MRLMATRLSGLFLRIRLFPPGSLGGHGLSVPPLRRKGDMRRSTWSQSWVASPRMNLTSVKNQKE